MHKQQRSYQAHSSVARKLEQGPEREVLTSQLLPRTTRILKLHCNSDELTGSL